MSRIILISSFAALLTASGIQSANATQTANPSGWDRDALACAYAVSPRAAEPSVTVSAIYTIPCGPPEIWKIPDCSLVSGLRVSAAQTARDLPAAILICISRTSESIFATSSLTAEKYVVAKGGLVAAGRQADLKARMGNIAARP
jgi:hypothetical protein